MHSHRRRSGTGRAVGAVAVAAVVLVVAGGVAAYAANRTSAPTYRTATVAVQPVDQVLAQTGTIAASASAVVTFPVSGTVASVPVAMGDTVAAGQTLAALATTSLRDLVATANASVAQAKLTVAQDETSQSTSATTATTGSTASTGGSSAAPGRTGSSASGAARALAAAQQRLVGAVRQVDAMLGRTKTDLALSGSLCPAGGSPSPTPSATGSPSASPSPTGSPSPSPSPTPSGGHGPGGGVPTTCTAAQQLVLADETTVSRLQQGVFAQEAALQRLITAAARAGAASATTSSGTTSRATTGTRSGTGSATASGTGTGPVSAAQLAADQAGVDAAVAQYDVAVQNLAQATMVSPIAGVVSAVTLAVGQQATAGSASSSVDVIDPAGHSVSLSVDVTKIPEVRVGEKAMVVPDGSTTALPATVTYVAVAPTGSGSTTYPVTLSFTSNPGGLRDGIQAAVTITTAQATGGVTVPTSAIYHLGQLSYVLLLDGASTKRQDVTVGAVGATYTQVTHGLSVGQQVVLADVRAPIPSTTTSSRFARFAAGAGAGGLGGLGGTTGLTGAGAGRAQG